MKKTIRVLVTAMVELETELESEEAIKEFEQESMYAFENTDNITVIETEWRDTTKVSVVYEGTKSSRYHQVEEKKTSQIGR